MATLLQTGFPRGTDLDAAASSSYGHATNSEEYTPFLYPKPFYLHQQIAQYSPA